MNSYRLARFTALFSYLLLIALYLYWCVLFGPEDILAKGVLWLLMSSGLLLVAPGMFRGRKRSHQWLCFILLLYFVWEIQSLLVRPVAADNALPPSLFFNQLRLSVVVICFIAAMLAARWTPTGGADVPVSTEQ